MSERLEKFKKNVESLKTEYTELRKEFDKPEVTDFDEIKLSVDELQKRVDTMKRSGYPVISDMKYHVEQIEMALGNIKRGIDNTGEIESQNNALKDLFDHWNGVKHDMESLQGDLDDLQNDIHLQRKTAGIDIHGVVSRVLKRANWGHFSKSKR